MIKFSDDIESHTVEDKEYFKKRVNELSMEYFCEHKPRSVEEQDIVKSVFSYIKNNI